MAGLVLQTKAWVRATGVGLSGGNLELSKDDLVSDNEPIASRSGYSRRVVVSSGLALAALGAVAPVAFAQRAPATIPVDELMKPGSELPDIVIGKADAPVTIIEYASMTCPHCAAFHNQVYPKLKEKYIDTGKARMIFREFPLDDTALAASMLARCVGGAGPSAMISDLFKRQEQWAFVPKNAVVSRLFDMARQAGFTKASFDKCLTDDKLLNQITAIRKRANDVFVVNSTPTFFINGTRLKGGSLADFDKAIGPLLKGS